MRGKADVVLNRIDRIGITPAYAGKSSAFANSSHTRRDHPRLCGEKIRLGDRRVCVIGSPPPMRGKGRTDHALAGRAGITPAYAGKRFHTPEKYVLTLGSPPPMRGKGHIRAIDTVVEGITPAYAGKSSCFFSASYILKDHPRLCGEKPSLEITSMLRTGSPPPMRGKGYQKFNRCPQFRITPAYAGKRNPD